jgi:hypothetical protein
MEAGALLVVGDPFEQCAHRAFLTRLWASYSYRWMIGSTRREGCDPS